MASLEYIYNQKYQTLPFAITTEYNRQNEEYIKRRKST